MLGTVIDSRHEVLSKLGEGGMGAVYKVYDRVLDRVCALKWVPKTTGADTAVSYFQSEFRVIAGLRHPNIVRVYDYGVTSTGDAYFTMELIEGQPLSSLFDPRRPQRFFNAAADLCGVLAFVHERGIIHRDIKPQNIVVVRDPSNGEYSPKLLDFGLAAPVSRTWQLPSGTLAYMAPEVLRGRGGDDRSDLFSFGAVLYESVVGVAPFAIGDSATETIRAVLEYEPQPPDARRPNVHPRLAEIIVKLLRKEPSLRYHAASEVQAELEALALGRPRTREAQSVALIGGASLVGRDESLAALSSYWRDAYHGRGHCVFLLGEEGIGKTRLLDELRVHVQLDGGRVLDVACDLSSVSAPLLPVERLFRDVATLAGDTPDDTSDALSLLSADADAPWGVTVSEEIQRLVSELSSRLLRLTRGHAVLLTVEDLHAAAPEVRDFCRMLALHLRGGPVLTCVTMREEPLQESSSGRGLLTQLDSLVGESGVRVTRLGRLTREGCGRLVERLLGRVEGVELLIDRIYAETDGNPLLVEEALRYLVDEGVLRRKAGRFTLAVGADLLDSVSFSPGVGVRDAVSRRLQHVDPGILRVLEVGAVEGEPFTAAALARPAGVSEEEAAAALRAAERRALVRRVEDGVSGAFVFAQAAVRSVVYQQIEPTTRRRLHAFVGQRLERTSPEPRGALAEALTRHYLQAGMARRALRHGLLAASRCEARLVPSRAVELYAALLPILGDRTGAWALRLRLQERMGDLQVNLGRFSDALVAYRHCLGILVQRVRTLESKSRRITTARVKRKLGDVLARLSRYEEARLLLGEAAGTLETFKEEPESLEICYVSAWCRMMQAEYGEAVKEARAGLELARRFAGGAMEARFQLLLANLFWNSGEWRASVAAAREALHQFRRVGHSRGLADAYLALGSAYRYTAEYGKAATNYRLALEIYQGLGAVAYVGKCHNNLGVIHYLRGRWTEAAREWEAFVEVCERTGERHERVMLLNNLGVLYSDRGELERAEQTVRQGLELARRIGFARIEAMLESNLGEILCRKGRLSDAEEAYQRCGAIASEIDARDELVELGRRRCELDFLRNDMPALRRRLAETLESARTLGARVEEAALLRLRAAFHRRAEELGQAAEDLAQAREIATDVGAKVELHRLDVEEALLLKQRGESEAARTRILGALDGLGALGATWEVKRAEAALQSLDAPVSSSPTAIDLARLLDINRKLGTILDLDDLLRNILDVVLEITQSERGFIIVHDQDGLPIVKVTRDPGHRLHHDDIRISRSVADRVFRTGESICIANVDEDQQFSTTKSVIALELRSILCVPMIVKGRTLGVIYTDSRTAAPHSLVRSQPLLEALGSQAAVAIENARLYEEQRHKTEMISTVAHELKSPLTAILGYLSIMQQSASRLPEDFQDYLQIVFEQSERLSRMVRNILDLRAIESGGNAWSMTAVPISEVLRSSIEGLRPIADISRIQVFLELPGERVDVFGNRDRIQQVLTNLFTNAVKFTPAGGRIVVRAEVVALEQLGAQSERSDELGPVVLPVQIAELSRAARFLSNDRCLRISITDTGPGIASTDVKRIFEKFAQGVTERKGDRGIGLGLSISREIVARHGGRIWVETAPGTGSTFYFTLLLMGAQLQDT